MVVTAEIFVEGVRRMTFPMTRASGCPFDPAREYADFRRTDGPSKVSTPAGVDAWVFSRYDDVRTVLRDSRLSSRSAPSAHVVPGADLEREIESGSIIQTDAGPHRRLRRLLAPEFAVKRMEALRPRIVAMVEEHIDVMLATGGPVDLVEAFALPIPSLVICELLGVPYADRAEFQQRSAILVSIDRDKDEVTRVSDELNEYMVGLVLAKQAHREDDLLSRLITRGEDQGRPLTLAELVSIGITLLIAGHETTANMMALSTLALLRNPTQLAALRQDPSLAPAAVEELLRYLSVVQFGLFRHVTEDIPRRPDPASRGIPGSGLVLRQPRHSNLCGPGQSRPDPVGGGPRRLRLRPTSMPRPTTRPRRAAGSVHPPLLPPPDAPAGRPVRGDPLQGQHPRVRRDRPSRHLGVTA
jgi:cytochrome P450